jgi:hypothetical protein
LSQKQGIEQQMESATATLAYYEDQKKTQDAAHTKKLASINAEINSVQNQLADVRATITYTQDETQLASLRSQEASLVSRSNVLKNSRDNENTIYGNQNQTTVYYINQAKARIGQVTQQDTQFNNNVETVQGYVAIDWINLWTLLVLLSPVHPILIIIVLVILLFWFLHRKGYTPKFEFV